MSSITLTNVWKIYGKDIVAVRDLNLYCEDHEFLAFLGPSGCGKTSTLRMIAGLEEISAGTIRIGDRVVNDLRPRERDIAMVFETYGLYPHLSVYDNIAFPLRVRKLNETEIAQRVERASNVVDLSDTLKHFPSELGDGQKQRVSIARAIVREPSVFLFDEPISHLDEELRRRMRKEIKHLQATLGTTMVYVTHDQIEAMALADRVVVMDMGVVKQVGSPLELFDQPANLFVAGFVGEPPMNLVRGELIRENGTLRFEAGTFHVPVTNPAFARALESHGKQQVILGVRPCHIDPAYEPNETSIPAEVYGLEPHGDYNIVTTRQGDDVLLSLSGSSFFPEPGAAIHLHFGSNLHFFDIETEHSILYTQGAYNG